MTLRIAALLVAVLALSCFAQQSKPALKLSIDVLAINNLIQTNLSQYLAQNFTTPATVVRQSVFFIPITINASSGLVHSLSLNVKDTGIILDEANNNLIIELSNLSVIVDVPAKVSLPLLQTDVAVHAEVHVDFNSSFKMDFNYDLNCPNVTLESFTLNFTQFDINLGPGFLPGILNFFVGMAKSSIIGGIRSAIQGGINGAVKSYLQNLKLVSNVSIPIGNTSLDYAIDYSIAQAIGIKNNHIEIFAKALFFDPKEGGKFPPVNPPKPLPAYDTQKGGLQVAISDVTIDSLLYLIHQSGILKYKVEGAKTQIETIKLDTTQFKYLIPGLYNTFGPDRPINIYAKTTTAPDMVFEATHAMDIVIAAEARFVVETENEGEKDAFTLLLKLRTDIEPSLREDNLYVAIENIAILEISASSSQIGNVPVDNLQTLLNSTFKILCKTITNYIEHNHGIQKIDILKRYFITDPSITIDEGSVGLLGKFGITNERLG